MAEQSKQPYYTFQASISIHDDTGRYVNGGTMSSGVNADNPQQALRFAATRTHEHYRRAFNEATGNTRHEWLHTVQVLPGPEIVTLCGSTRFMDTFHEANRLLSLAGGIVLSVEIVTYDGASDPQRASPGQKERLDELHLRKIEKSDRVLILNVDDYVGESTARELQHARDLGLPVDWWQWPTKHAERKERPYQEFWCNTPDWQAHLADLGLAYTPWPASARANRTGLPE